VIPDLIIYLFICLFCYITVRQARKEIDVKAKKEKAGVKKRARRAKGDFQREADLHLNDVENGLRNGSLNMEAVREMHGSFVSIGNTTIDSVYVLSKRNKAKKKSNESVVIEPNGDSS